MSDRRPTLELTVRCDVRRKDFSLAVDPRQMVSALPEGKSTVAAICPDCRTSRLNEVLVLEATAGDRVRIAIPYDDTWRHIFWFRVSRRGDIYCTFGFGVDYIGEAEDRLETCRRRARRSEVRRLRAGRSRKAERWTGVVPRGRPDQPGRPTNRRNAARGAIGAGDPLHDGLPAPLGVPPLAQIGDRDVILRLGVAEDRALVAVLHFVPPG
jgi:hypothetical protein